MRLRTPGVERIVQGHYWVGETGRRGKQAPRHGIPKAVWGHALKRYF